MVILRLLREEDAAVSWDEFWDCEFWVLTGEAGRRRHVTEPSSIPSIPGGRLPPREKKDNPSHLHFSEMKSPGNFAIFTDSLGSSGAPKTNTDDTLNAVSEGLVVCQCDELLGRKPDIWFLEYLLCHEEKGLTCWLLSGDEELVVKWMRRLLGFRQNFLGTRSSWMRHPAHLPKNTGSPVPLLTHTGVHGTGHGYVSRPVEISRTSPPCLDSWSKSILDKTPSSASSCLDEQLNCSRVKPRPYSPLKNHQNGSCQ